MVCRHVVSTQDTKSSISGRFVSWSMRQTRVWCCGLMECDRKWSPVNPAHCIFSRPTIECETNNEEYHLWYIVSWFSNMTWMAPLKNRTCSDEACVWKKSLSTIGSMARGRGAWYVWNQAFPQTTERHECGEQSGQDGPHHGEQNSQTTTNGMWQWNGSDHSWKSTVTATTIAGKAGRVIEISRPQSWTELARVVYLWLSRYCQIDNPNPFHGVSNPLIYTTFRPDRTIAVNVEYF